MNIAEFSGIPRIHSLDSERLWVLEAGEADACLDSTSIRHVYAQETEVVPSPESGSRYVCRAKAIPEKQLERLGCITGFILA